MFDYVTIACAFRWGVAFVGDYHYWALLTPSWDPPFQVQGVCTRTALTRGRVLEASRVVALVSRCIHVLECYNFNICWIRFPSQRGHVA